MACRIPDSDPRIRMFQVPDKRGKDYMTIHRKRESRAFVCYLCSFSVLQVARVKFFYLTYLFQVFFLYTLVMLILALDYHCIGDSMAPKERGRLAVIW